jgi:hypothetical protein
MEHFPNKIVEALKDAIVKIFWTRQDLRALLRRAIVSETLVSAQDWTAYKYHIASPIIDSLNSTHDGLGPLRRLLQETLEYKDGSHLLRFQDGEKRRKDAERALDYLRILVKDHESSMRTEQEKREARVRSAQEQGRAAAFNSRLRAIHDRFLSYHQHPDRQERGYALEEILYDMFLLFELNPQGPFRRIGEQIDGAFYHDVTHFLLEAKWQKDPVNLADLRDLDGAVGTSLDNTLGLFVSLNGFSQAGLDGYRQGNRPKIVCMDGMDLMSVLSGQIDLGEVLRRKRDLAVQSRNVFVPVSAILSGKV